MGPMGEVSLALCCRPGGTESRVGMSTTCKIWCNSQFQSFSTYVGTRKRHHQLGTSTTQCCARSKTAARVIFTASSVRSKQKLCRTQSNSFACRSAIQTKLDRKVRE